MGKYVIVLEVEVDDKYIPTYESGRMEVTVPSLNTLVCWQVDGERVFSGGVDKGQTTWEYLAEQCDWKNGTRA